MVAVVLGTLVITGLVRAPPPGDNPGQPFQEILDAIADLQSGQDALQDDVDDLGEQLDDVESKVDDIEDKLDVLSVEAIGTEAFADPGEGPVQVPAVNDALILVRVTFKGEGVSGLVAANFDIATRIVPPGECELEIDDLAIFGTHYAGDYAFRVTPIDTFAGCNWAAGTYISSIEVSALGMKGSTLVSLVIT